VRLVVDAGFVCTFSKRSGIVLHEWFISPVAQPGRPTDSDERG